MGPLRVTEPMTTIGRGNHVRKGWAIRRGPSPSSVWDYNINPPINDIFQSLEALEDSRAEIESKLQGLCILSFFGEALEAIGLEMDGDGRRWMGMDRDGRSGLVKTQPTEEPRIQGGQAMGIEYSRA